ncbi:hypothetical protein [Luteibacter sp. CQ10]|uniref:hypothetical protein n=1 Tax=Luteibacter sp. CQ10 TaxID=2805821 RepID=UPI0034A3824C
MDDAKSDEKNTFQISLAMAGAISAGAYSAGVIDFLFESLDAWDKAKRDHPDSVPNHKVVITAIAGASAGSITGVLAALAPRFGIPARQPATAKTAGYTLKAMYDAWVVNIDMLNVGEAFSGLLSTGDLDGKGEVTSLLNSKVLEHIGDVAFGYVPANATPTTLPFISSKLHVYLTITNLRGVPYEVVFSGDDALDDPQGKNCKRRSASGYGMLNHGDRAHYIITGLGSSPLFSTWAGADAGKTLSVATLPVTGQALGGLAKPWKTCLTAALASSAFPIGLAPQVMSVDYLDFGRRSWPFDEADGLYLAPSFPCGYAGDTNSPGLYGFSCVDGGVINNEPFDFAHKALLPLGKSHNDTTATGADRAVIMVDPFPELPEFDVSGDSKKLDVISVLVRMFLGLKDQARFKPDELVAALDENRYSRFLIGPRREATEISAPGTAPVTGLVENAIACGLLGGFGGFLSREFRDFDYQLGRRNCQWFLRESLAVDEKNKVVEDWPPSAASNPAFQPLTGKKNQRCVIPLVGVCAEEIAALPAWPRLKDSDLDKILNALDKRVDKLFPRFRDNIPGRFARTAAGAVWKLGLKSYVLKYAEWAVKADLIQRDQSATFVLPTVAHRVVLSAMANPKYDYCKAAYLAKLAGMTEGNLVQLILKPSEKDGLVTYSPKNGAWTLAAREKSFWARLRDSVTVGAASVAE